MGVRERKMDLLLELTHRLPGIQDILEVTEDFLQVIPELVLQYLLSVSAGMLHREQNNCNRTERIYKELRFYAKEGTGRL